MKDDENVLRVKLEFYRQLFQVCTVLLVCLIGYGLMSLLVPFVTFTVGIGYVIALIVNLFVIVLTIFKYMKIMVKHIFIEED